MLTCGPIFSVTSWLSTGQIDQIRQPAYSFTDLDPCYFQRATLNPNDYLGSFLKANSTFGEPTFAEAASLLAPPHDYKELGLPSAYWKWSVTQDGFIKSAVGSAIYGPLDEHGSPGGQTGFSPAAETSWWPAVNFTDYKAAVHGSYGRAVHIGAYDRAAGRGFTMSAIAAGHGLGRVSVTNSPPSTVFWLTRETLMGCTDSPP